MRVTRSKERAGCHWQPACQCGSRDDHPTMPSIMPGVPDNLLFLRLPAKALADEPPVPPGRSEF